MKARDDRGKLVPLHRLDRAAMREVERPPLRIDPRQMERSNRVEREGFRQSMLLNVLFIVVIIGLWIGASPCLAVLALIMALAGSTWLLVRRIERIRLVHHMLARPVCPSCGHSLRGLPVEEDGCSVCPECGAAWHMPERQGGQEHASSP